MEGRVDAIATGLEADIIALDGDPLTDSRRAGRVGPINRPRYVTREARQEPPRRMG